MSVDNGHVVNVVDGALVRVCKKMTDHSLMTSSPLSPISLMIAPKSRTPYLSPSYKTAPSDLHSLHIFTTTHSTESRTRLPTIAFLSRFFRSSATHSAAMSAAKTKAQNIIDENAVGMPYLSLLSSHLPPAEPVRSCLSQLFYSSNSLTPSPTAAFIPMTLLIWAS